MGSQGRPDLVGVDLKLGRAKQCLAELQDGRAELLSVNQNRTVGHFDPLTRDYVVRAEGKPPPIEWGLAVSELAHFLRSSLDNLLWQLILAREETPQPGVTQFPIHKKRTDFEGKPRSPGKWNTEAERRTWGVRADDFTFIEQCQPFHAGKDRHKRSLVKWHPLAMLSHINNVDKHRYVHVAFAAASIDHAIGAAGVVHFSGGITVAVADGPMEVVPVLFASGRIDPDAMLQPYPMLQTAAGGNITVMGFPPSDDRAEVARAQRIDEPESDVQVYPPLTLEISFSNGERPLSIFDLRDIYGYVVSIVDHFRPVFD